MNLFYKWRLMGQRNMHLNRGDAHPMCTRCHSLSLHLHIDGSEVSQDPRNLMHPWWEFSKTQKEYNLTVLCSRLGKWGKQQPQEVTLSIWTRICLKCSEKAMAFLQMCVTNGRCHILSYSCYFSVLATYLMMTSMTEGKAK